MSALSFSLDDVQQFHEPSCNRRLELVLMPYYIEGPIESYSLDAHFMEFPFLEFP